VASSGHCNTSLDWRTVMSPIRRCVDVETL
jgi:hypothetical protein